MKFLSLNFFCKNSSPNKFPLFCKEGLGELEKQTQAGHGDDFIRNVMEL